MKKTMAVLGLAMTLSLVSGMTAFAAWEQKDGRWYYYDGQGNMLKDTWVGNYYVGADGAMLTDTLTPEGYWLDGTGLASEDKRTYGGCIFSVTSYQKNGDGFLITGDICSAGYASEEYLRSLKVGDVIWRPADDDHEQACVFDTRSVVTDISDDSYGDHNAYGEYQEGRMRRAVYHRLAMEGSPEAEWGYTFYSDHMARWERGSMAVPIYRIIEKDVVLVFDAGSEFVPIQDGTGHILSRSMSEFLEKRYRWVLKISVINGCIKQAADLMTNYVG